MLIRKKTILVLYHYFFLLLRADGMGGVLAPILYYEVTLRRTANIKRAKTKR